MVRAVVGAVAVFDGSSIAMLVTPAVGLLFFVFAAVVVMVVMSTMGFHRRAQAYTGDDHHERGDAKTLNNRHGSSMDWGKRISALPDECDSTSARCDWMRLEVVIPFSVSVRCSSTTQPQRGGLL